MTKAATPKPPKHLSVPMRRWWAAVLRDFDLEESDLKLLTLAAEAHDRCTAAREVIETSGAFYSNRYGEPRAHPAVAVERDSRIAFARLLRELGLDGEPIEPDVRPPRLGSSR